MYIHHWLCEIICVCSTLVIEKSHNWVSKILVILYYAYFTKIGVVWRHNFTNTYSNPTQMHTDHICIYITDCVKLCVCCYFSWWEITKKSIKDIHYCVVCLLYWNWSCLEAQLHKHLFKPYTNKHRADIHIHHWLCQIICVLLCGLLRNNRNEDQKYWVLCSLPTLLKLVLFGGTTL